MTLSINRKDAPGPSGHLLLGNLPEFQRDVFQLLIDSAQRFGNVVRLRLGPLVIHLLSHPDHITHVLQDNRQNYQKTTRSDAMISSVIGKGLFTTNGEVWKERRRLMQPAFHHDRIASFAHTMTETVTTMLRKWGEDAGHAQALDVASEMMRLTYAIVAKSLFRTDADDDAATVEGAMAVVLEHTYRRMEKLFTLPEIVPTPANRRFREAMRTLDRVVYGLIHARRRDETDVGDLLSMLMRTRDEETGQGLSDQELRDEAITILSAGHVTTANVLTRMWSLLSTHPDVERQLDAELAAVLGGGTPTLDDIPRLGYTTMVIKEVMRLYPPIWVIERKVVRDDEIEGYHIPAGSEVAISPYVMHHHPAFWENPEGFDPERFSAERSASRPRYAYLPFGGGPRLCIGHQFAMMEAQLITAMIAQTYRLYLIPGFPVDPKPWKTLRPSQGLLMTLQQKEPHDSDVHKAAHQEGAVIQNRNCSS